jgi:MFS family permease
MSASAAEPPLPTGAVKWAIIATCLLGAFLFSLNAKGTILEANVIIQAVSLDRYKVQWVNGPAGVAGLVALFSSIYLGQVIGARRVFLLGAVCLAAGSFGTALMRTGAQDVVAGLVRSGAGFLAIPGLTLLQRLLPRRRRLTYCIYLALIYGGQVIAEPVGALLTFHPSWRALFLGLGAGGLLLALGALFLFPDDRPARPPDQPFDFAGAVLFAAGLGLLFFLLYRGNYLGWLVSTPVWVASSALVAVVVLFVWREGVAPAPFIGLRAFTRRTVALTLLSAVFWCGALYGVAVQLPFALLLIGYEHVKTGWVMLPMSLAVLATMLVGGSVAWRRGGHVWALRIGLAGMTAAGFALARLDLYTSWPWVMGVSFVWAVFAGMCLAPIAVLTFEGQPAEEAGTTGAMKFLLRALGSTLGVLIAGVLIDRGTAWGLEFVRDGVRHGQGALQLAEPDVRDHMARHGSAPPAAAAQADALLGYWVNLHARVIGYRIGLRFCAYLSAAGLVVSCFISRRKEISIYDTDL